MSADLDRIVILENGPYLVGGGLPLELQRIGPDNEGGSWTWTAGKTFEVGERSALFRCGAFEYETIL